MASKLLTISTTLLAGILFASPALAQSEQAGGDSAQAARWLVSCDNRQDTAALNCVMSQSLFQANSRQRIMTATLQEDAQGVHYMRLLLPHGLDFKKGVTFSIDDGDIDRHTINTADASGAYARFPVNGDLIDRMKAGKTITLGVNSMSGNTINLQLSLEGFSSAFGLMSN